MFCIQFQFSCLQNGFTQSEYCAHKKTVDKLWLSRPPFSLSAVVAESQSSAAQKARESGISIISKLFESIKIDRSKRILNLRLYASMWRAGPSINFYFDEWSEKRRRILLSRNTAIQREWNEPISRKKYNNHEKKVVVVDLLLYDYVLCVVEFLRCARDFQSKEPLALGSMNSTIDPTSGETHSRLSNHRSDMFVHARDRKTCCDAMLSSLICELISASPHECQLVIRAPVHR